MDITATGRNSSGSLYRQGGTENKTQDSGFLQALQEAGSRMQQKEPEDPWQVIAARKEEIREKLRNGDTEVKYQIGGSSYTEKEWERMMEQFDSLEEAIRNMMEERREKQRQYAFRQILGEPEAEEASS